MLLINKNNKKVSVIFFANYGTFCLIILQEKNLYKKCRQSKLEPCLIFARKQPEELLL